MLRGDGQKGQVAGHTRRCAETGEGGDGGGAGEALGTTPNISV